MINMREGRAREDAVAATATVVYFILLFCEIITIMTLYSNNYFTVFG